MAPDSNLAKKRTGMLVSRWSQHAGGPPGRSSVPQWPRGQDDEVTSALFSDHRLHRIISRGLRGSKGGRAERAHQTPPQCTGNLNSGGKAGPAGRGRRARTTRSSVALTTGHDWGAHQSCRRACGAMHFLKDALAPHAEMATLRWGAGGRDGPPRALLAPG